MFRFGGLSLSTLSRTRAAAERLARHLSLGARIVAVVSTPTPRTSRLFCWIQRQYADGSPLVARELDRAAAAEEQLTAALLAASAVVLGAPAASLRPQELRLEGEGDFGAGQLTGLDVFRILELLNTGRLVVVPGGHVHRPDGETLMLAQGRADVTAVVLALALGATACHVVTDRYRVVPLSIAGPPVHPEASRLAEERGLAIETYSFRAPFPAKEQAAGCGGSRDRESE